MNADVESYIGKFDEAVQGRFLDLRQLLLESVPCEVEEKLWAKLPSYYRADKFVRLIPFKDHINIEASAISAHERQLVGYKRTPKGMLQVYHNQDIPTKALKAIYIETLFPSSSK